MSRIKEAFTSRFKGGVILECDFSQLEVVGLAALSQDPQLIQDILDGRDMHRFFAAQLFKIPEEQVTKQQRSLTKKFTFALQYGSGAAGLAKKNGTTKKVAEEFIRVYYERYKRVAEWQQEVYNAVVSSRVVTRFHTPAGYPMGRGEYESMTGRIYVFNEKDPPEIFRSRDPNFNPPEIKNYPVQGFATGDVMALFRARMVRRWIADYVSNPEYRTLVLMINTVHDSVMFDCAGAELAWQVKAMLEEIAATLQDEVRSLWGIEAPVPFKIETSMGPSWANQTKMEKH